MNVIKFCTASLLVLNLVFIGQANAYYDRKEHHNTNTQIITTIPMPVLFADYNEVNIYQDESVETDDTKDSTESEYVFDETQDIDKDQISTINEPLYEETQFSDQNINFLMSSSVNHFDTNSDWDYRDRKSSRNTDTYCEPNTPPTPPTSAGEPAGLALLGLPLVAYFIRGRKK